jgi:hypothetical protein
MHSKINGLIPPSQADLRSIKRSFASAAFFNTELDGECKRTDVKESSVGWGFKVVASVELTRTVALPLRHVKESTVREAAGERHSSQFFLSLLFLSEGIVLLLHLVSFFMVLVSMVPSFELWMNVIQPASVWIAVSTLAMLLATEIMSFLVFLRDVLLLAVLEGHHSKDVPHRKGEPWGMLMLNQVKRPCA